MNPLEYLCSRDKRSPYYLTLDDGYDLEARSDCHCDNCFYGRDKLANALIESQRKVERLRSALKVISTWCKYELKDGCKPAFGPFAIANLCRKALDETK